ncbi:MAG: dephospho-CoA kinase [Thermodesulfobacteriota bacterium]
MSGNMNTSTDWAPMIRRFEQLLRLRSFPVAFKMLEDRADLEKIPFLRPCAEKVTLCQLITRVRCFDWTVGATTENFLSPACPSIIGLAETPELFRDGTFRSIVWVRTREDGRRYEASIPKLPVGRYQAVALAPLVYNPFDPDLVLLYANPAQMMLLINALQFEDYEVLRFFCVGESSCADAIVRCYQDGKPALTIPCYGERRYGHAQDDELVMALPASYLAKALRGLETLYRRGVRYPICFAGAERDLSASFPAAYGGLEMIESLRGQGRDHRLLVAVTGGIASGKSVVAAMLEELGAPMIDFDVLARRVVEPGRPAYNDIVEFFGRQVLQEDGALDRKKLSGLVFSDLEKRKKLESFTHPRISLEFARRLEEITARDPEAVVQAVVPLLIEINLQYLFHKVVVVYVRPEVQVQRLVQRDGLTEAEAANILKAQLPIDEKVGYADFVINNEGTLAETRRQVETLWEELKKARPAEPGG